MFIEKRFITTLYNYTVYPLNMLNNFWTRKRNVFLNHRLCHHEKMTSFFKEDPEDMQPF